MEQSEKDKGNRTVTRMLISFMAVFVLLGCTSSISDRRSIAIIGTADLQGMMEPFVQTYEINGSSRKIEENIQAEIMEVCKSEALERYKCIIEVDTTGKGPEESAREIARKVWRPSKGENATKRPTPKPRAIVAGLSLLPNNTRIIERKSGFFFFFISAGEKRH